jgi:hypothetical protein
MGFRRDIFLKGSAASDNFARESTSKVSRWCKSLTIHRPFYFPQGNKLIY